MMYMAQSYEKKTRVLFFFAMVICLFFSLYNTSVWFGHTIGKYISWIGLILLFPRIIAVLNCVKREYRIIFFLLIPFLLAICLNVVEKDYVLYIFLFCFCAWNIPFKLIVKVYFIISLSFIVLTFLASNVGIIQNLSYSRYEFEISQMEHGITNKERFCFGFQWPTTFAAHITLLNVMYLYLKNGVLKISDYLISIFLIMFLYYYCDCRNEVVCMTLIILFSLYYRFRVRKANKILLIEKSILLYSVPICATIMFFFTYQYYNSGNEFYTTLNLLFSNRLHLGADILYSKGVKLFGQEFIQRGGDSIDYNFIDSSYLVWIIIYGLFFFILSILLFVFLCKKSIIQREYLVAICVVIIAIQGLMIPSLLTFHYNPFFMGLFAKYEIKQ